MRSELDQTHTLNAGRNSSRDRHQRDVKNSTRSEIQLEASMNHGTLKSVTKNIPVKLSRYYGIIPWHLHTIVTFILISILSFNHGPSSFIDAFNHLQFNDISSIDHNPSQSMIRTWPIASHRQYKRQSDSITRLTNESNPPGSAGFSSSNPVQNGWFDILSGLLPRPQPSLPKPPVNSELDGHIRNILVPRVSGTQGNINVRNYIVDELEALNYHVSLDDFTDNTPLGKVRFANIIATTEPRACKQLAIACHYDSKRMDGFLGAIDSAVPCAMMLSLAKTFNSSFRAQRDDNNNMVNQLGLMFIFFDGEEAFQEWTATDSLYGSRHLASKWEKQPSPAYCGLENELKRLDLLMVLDLIGTSDTSFTMYSRKLKGHYQNMQKYERNYIRDKIQLQGARARQAATFKNDYIPLEFMQDDHVPFYKRGVPVLSLLASPFPSVWHTVNDNYDAIDFAKTEQVLHILEKFISNYKAAE